MPQTRFGLICLVAGLLWAASAPAATWSVDATVSNEYEKEETEEGSDITETFDQSYTISYETDLNPALSLGLEFALDITDELNEPDFDTREVNPSVDLDLLAVWWDVTASWEQTEESSKDPNVDTTKDNTWDLEFTAEPALQILPDVRVKYQRDRNREGGDTQTVDEALEATLDYTLWNLFEISFDASKDTREDKVNADSDTEDKKYTLDVTFDRDLGDHWKVEVDWTNERNQSVTLSDDNDVLQRDDTLRNNLRGQIAFVPVEALELSLEREFEWDKDLENDPLEKTDTWTGVASFSASLTDAIDLELSYEEEREFTDGTDSDSDRTRRDYAFALDFSPLDFITISPSYDRTDEKEDFEDSDQENEDTVDETWEIELHGSVWADQIEYAVTRTWDTTEEDGKRTTKERNWDVDLTLTHEGIPNLELAPQYSYTEDKDLLKETTDREHEVEVGLLYELSLNDVLTFTLDHTYSRTKKDPAEGKSTVEREDDTDLTISWQDFFEGMGLELGLTRNASDESKDDKGPEIDYTYTATLDWEILDNYTVSFEYEFDDKDESEDTRNFLTTVSMEFLDGLLTVDFEYELDEELEGDKDKTHRYLIEVRGTF